jgi:hypothetical protein
MWFFGLQHHDVVLWVDNNLQISWYPAVNDAENYTHVTFVLCRFVLYLLAFMPLTDLHHFLIYALSFSA